MFKIPSSDRIFSQPNNSDVNGNIFATKNINFDEEGYLKLSPGSYKMTSADADFQEIQSMFKTASTVYYLSDDIFTSDAGIKETFSNLTASEGAPTPGPEDDGTFFNGNEVISDGATIRYRDGGSWTTISGTGLPTTVGLVTCMEVFPEKNSLLVGRGNEVAIVPTTWTPGTSLVLPSQYEVTSIACIGATAYIATRSAVNGDAMLFLWDGAGADPNAAYSVGTFELSTIKNYQSSICGVDSLGRFIRFNGGGFDVISAFPIYYTKYDWGDANNQYSFISNRGMYVEGDIVYFNISSQLERDETQYLQNMPGGLWCFDPKIGLYHRASQSKNVLTADATALADVNTTDDEITVTSAPETGTPVFYEDDSLTIGGLFNNTWYYVINVDATTIKLAKTPDEAISGNAIDLTSVSGTSANLYFMTRADWGDTYTYDRTSVLSLPNTLYDSLSSERIIFSNLIKDSSDADNYGVSLLDSNLENRGYFITPKMFASNIDDVFNTITLRFRPLKYGDEIRIKYRTSEKSGDFNKIYGDSTEDYRITWTSTTTFTTIQDWSEVVAGDEVEIVGGQGSGHIAHVSSISESAGTYTVTIDEACSVVSNGDYGKAIAQNWTFVETIDYTYEQGWKSITIDQPSSWIQFKIELRGRETTIEELIVNNRVNQQSR